MTVFYTDMERRKKAERKRGKAEKRGKAGKNEKREKSGKKRKKTAGNIRQRRGKQKSAYTENGQPVADCPKFLQEMWCFIPFSQIGGHKIKLD